jgi:hypothetical protein
MISLLAQYALLALGLMASLSLFLALKHEIQVHKRKQRRHMEEMAREVQHMSEQRPEVILVPTAPRSGFNVSRRVQALRMLRRGEDVSHIAAALGVPCQEIELLIRVQAIVRTSISRIEDDAAR